MAESLTDATYYLLLDDGCKILLDDDSGGALILDESGTRLWVRQPTEPSPWEDQEFYRG